MVNRAFTLIEVLAAVALLALALLGIVQGQAGSVKSVVRSEAMSQAVALAQQIMTETELELKKKNFEAFAEEDKGEFKEDKLKAFRYVRKFEVVDLGCFLPTNLGESGDEQGQQQQGMLGVAEDIFEKAIRKITVTVQWDEGSRVRSAELTQLYVRFEDINLNIKSSSSQSQGGDRTPANPQSPQNPQSPPQDPQEGGSQ